jgi:WD40 repeat protein
MDNRTLSPELFTSDYITTTGIAVLAAAYCVKECNKKHIVQWNIWDVPSNPQSCKKGAVGSLCGTDSMGKAYATVPKKIKKLILNYYYDKHYQEYRDICERYSLEEKSFPSLMKFLDPNTTHYLHGLLPVENVYDLIPMLCWMKGILVQNRDVAKVIADYSDELEELSPRAHAHSYHVCHTLTIGGQPIVALQIVSDASVLAAVHKDSRAIQLCDIESGTIIESLEGHQSSITALSLSENRMASSDAEGTVRIWDMKTKECTYDLNFMPAPINALAFLGDICMAGADRYMSVGKMTQEPNLERMQFQRTAIHSIALQSGESAALAKDNGMIHVLNPDKGRFNFTLSLTGHAGNPVRKVIFTTIPEQSGSVTYLISAGDDKLIRFWNTSKDFASVALSGHRQEIYHLAATDRHLISAGDKEIILWDLKARKPIRIMQHNDTITALNANADMFVLGDTAGAITLWREWCERSKVDGLPIRKAMVSPAAKVLLLKYGKQAYNGDECSCAIQ